MNSFTTATTKILNPLLTAVGSIGIAIFAQQIPLQQKVFYFLASLLVAAIPAGVLYAQRAKGEVSSFWSPKGRERVKAFGVWVVVAAVYSGLAWFLDVPRLLVALPLVFLVLGLVNLALATSFKISIHSQIASLFALVAILTVGIGASYLIILIPLVAWARLQLKAHDLSEVSLGALSAVVVVYFVFSLFGLATF